MHIRQIPCSLLAGTPIHCDDDNDDEQKKCPLKLHSLPTQFDKSVIWKDFIIRFMVWCERGAKKKWVVAVNLTDHMIWTVCAHTSNLLRAAVRWVWFIQHKSGLATFCLPNTFAAIVYKCEGECNAIRYALMQFLWKCRVEITHFGCIRHRNNMHIAHTHVTELKH